MPRGGARLRSGPPPDMNALRRERDGKDWTKLPAAGRTGDPPPWPLPEDVVTAVKLERTRQKAANLREDWMHAEGRAAAALGRKLEACEEELAVLEATAERAEADEQEMWRRLWRTPQALVWEADGVADLVAMYVRAFLEASQPDAAAQKRLVSKQFADSLLLTTPALHSARYVIVPTAEDDEDDAPASPGKPAPPSGVRARAGLKVVGSDDA